MKNIGEKVTEGRVSMNRLQQYIFGKLGKLKHEIDLEAHAYDRLYWMDLRQRGMKEDLEKLKEKVAELEKARHDT